MATSLWARAAGKTASILLRGLSLYLLTYLFIVLSFLIAWAVTGYNYPDNPLEHDFPTPVLHEIIAFLVGPYAFWMVSVAIYDLIKRPHGRGDETPRRNSYTLGGL